MYTVGIVGASGYAGGELIRFVDAHPDFTTAALTAHSRAGEHLGSVHPHLDGPDRTLEAFDVDRLSAMDLVFLALPHGASAQPAMQLLDAGVRVVDLGSDFRLDSPARYEEAYGTLHPYPQQLGAWAYGIPEWFRKDIEGATAVAAPGCYPTSAVLGLAPLVASELVHGSKIIVDSVSGTSGAGRTVTEGLSFGAVDESVRAYKVLSHRHRPEMERALDALGDGSPPIIFTPHLVPMQRGILSTIYATVRSGVTKDVVDGAIDEAYGSSPFVRRITKPPETRWVVGSNNALISTHLDGATSTVIVIVAIDNLVKGAAGQAVQCANVMLGLDEATGLPSTGWMP